MTTCKALVPMDTQVLTVMKQIKESAHHQALASIKATTNCISIEGALSILNHFGYYNDKFHQKGQTWRIRDLKNEQYFPDLQGRMACETLIFWFWGGPPTRLKWYKGTLQTFLDDRILYEINQRGSAKVAKLIGIDLKGMANVSTP